MRGTGIDQYAPHISFGFAGSDELGGAVGATGQQTQLGNRLGGLGDFTTGFGHQHCRFIDTDGLLAGRTEGLNSSIKMIGKQREAFELRLANVEKRYMAQFTALDSAIASMTQTSNYLTQQLASLSSFA